MICVLVRLLIVSPASSEAERSFSALRRLKKWLRTTTMTETRLNSIAVCHIHRVRIDELDVIPLMRDFISRSDQRRSTLIWTVSVKNKDYSYIKLISYRVYLQAIIKSPSSR
jgi:hypothetical protein